MVSHLDHNILQILFTVLVGRNDLTNIDVFSFLWYPNTTTGFVLSTLQNDNKPVLLSVIIFLYVPLVSYYFALYIISMVMHDGKRRKQQHLSSVCVVCLQYFFCVYKSLFGGLVILRKLYSTFLYLYYNNRKFLILA